MGMRNHIFLQSNPFLTLHTSALKREAVCVFRKGVIHRQDYTVSHPKKVQCQQSPQWRPPNLYYKKLIFVKNASLMASLWMITNTRVSVYTSDVSDHKMWGTWGHKYGHKPDVFLSIWSPICASVLRLMFEERFNWNSFLTVYVLKQHLQRNHLTK
jgi:hypothetical protein